jgi:ATP-binding cassette subfamily C (CFTR/MRP) protein 1
VALQLVCLALWTRNSITKYAIAAAALSSVSMIGVVLLVALEYKRTVRPSSLTSIYLLVAIIADAIQIRTFLLRGYSKPFSIVLSVTMASKIVLLVLESWPKQKYLKPTRIQYGPEETMGVFGRSVFWWLNSLFWWGSRRILTSDDLFPLDRELRSDRLLNQIVAAWEKSNKSYFPVIY